MKDSQCNVDNGSAASGWNNPTADQITEARFGAQDRLWGLLEVYRPYLLSIANIRLPAAIRPAEAPSDLVQETMVKGARGFAEFRGTTAVELRGWLASILQHELANLIKKFARGKRDRSIEESVVIDSVDSQQLTPSALAQNDEVRERIMAVLSTLPDQYRQILIYRYQEDLSFGEIGTLMQRSEDAARKLWIRALQAAKAELGSGASSLFVIRK